MPRMLRRAAVLGATAHVASRHGQAEAGAEPEAAAPGAPVAPDQPAAAAPAVAAAAAAPAPAADPYGDLMKLKELLDAGALTQDEFDAQKQKVLGD